MTTDSKAVEEAETPQFAIPAGVRWLLPSLIVLLAGLAAFQLVWLLPRCVYLMQNFGVNARGYLTLLLSIPDWSAAVAALALGVVAFRQRGFIVRTALLAISALAINIGLLICLLGALSQLLSSLPAP